MGQRHPSGTVGVEDEVIHKPINLSSEVSGVLVVPVNETQRVEDDALGPVFPGNLEVFGLDYEDENQLGYGSRRIEEKTKRFRQNNLSIAHIARSVVCLGGEDGKVRFYDVEKDYIEGDFESAVEGGVSRVAFGHRANFLAQGGKNGFKIDLRRVDPKNFEQMGESSLLSGHTHELTCLGFLDDGQTDVLYSASLDGTAMIWNLERPDEFEVLRDPHGEIHTMDGCVKRQIFVSGGNGRVCLWDSRDRTIVSSLDSSGFVRSVLCCEKGEHTFLVGGSGLSVWDYRKLDEPISVLLEKHEGPGNFSKQSIAGSRTSYYDSLVEIGHDRFASISSPFSECIVWNIDGSLLHRWNLSGRARDCVYVPLDHIPSENVTILKGKKELGMGGQASVHRAELTVGRGTSTRVMEIAVKIRIPEVSADSEEEEFSSPGLHPDVKKEITIYRDISPHENILKCYGGFSKDLGWPSYPIIRHCIALQYCRGRDLEKWMQKADTVLNVLSKLKILLQIARGMRHLHHCGVVHKDLCAANVMVYEMMKPKFPQNVLVLEPEAEIGYVMKIGDLGLSGHAHTVHFDRNDKVIGRVEYLAPEINVGPPGKESDVYAFGILAWTVWTQATISYKKLLKSEEDFPQISATKRLLFLQQLRWIGENNYRPDLTVPVLSDMPEALKDLIGDCWTASARARPSFVEIVNVFEELVCQ